MNILITGSNGQLGSELKALASNYSSYHFFFTDKETLDITEKEMVRDFVSVNKIDVIINCAAYTEIDKAETDEIECDRINHYGVSILAMVADEFGASLIHFSTHYVFDGTRTTPYTEDDATAAESKYAITKLASERVVLAKCRKAMVIRTSWLFSTYGDHNILKSCYEKLIDKKSIAMCYDRIASPTYAKDLGELVYLILEQGIEPGIYNYTNEGVCSLFDMAKMLQRFANLEGEVYPISSAEYATKAYRGPYGILDKSKIKNTYKISIPYWVDSLEECINELIQKESK